MHKNFINWRLFLVSSCSLLLASCADEPLTTQDFLRIEALQADKLQKFENSSIVSELFSYYNTANDTLKTEENTSQEPIQEAISSSFVDEEKELTISLIDDELYNEDFIGPPPIAFYSQGIESGKVINLNKANYNNDENKEDIEPTQLAVINEDKLALEPENETSTPLKDKLSWWHYFDGLDLDGDIEKLLADNFTLRDLSARVAQAKASVDYEGAATQPKLSLEATSTRLKNLDRLSATSTTVDKFNNSHNIGVKSSWEIDIWGKNRNAVRSASAHVDSAIAYYQASLNSLIAQLAASKIAINSLHAKESLSRTIASNYRKMYDITKLRYESGSENYQLENLLQAQNLFNDSVVRTEAYSSQLKSAYYAYNILLGDLPETPAKSSINDLKNEIKIDISALEIPQYVPLDVISNRPDIIALEQELRAANFAVDDAVAQLYPSFIIGAGASYNKANLREIISPTNLVWNITSTISQVILSGGAYNANVEMHKTKYEQLIAQYNEVLLNSVKDIEEAMLNINLSNKNLSSAMQQMSNKASIVESQNIRYSSGTDNVLSLLNAQINFANSKIAYIDAKQSFYNSIIELYLAMGGNWVEVALN